MKKQNKGGLILMRLVMILAILALTSMPWQLNGVLICTEVGGRESPQIVSDGPDGAIVTWMDYRIGEDNQSIYAQRIPILRSEFSVPVVVECNGMSYIRTFGTDPYGTDGYDSGLDITCPPPGFTFYTYFYINTVPYYLDTDIRSCEDSQITWTLKIVNAHQCTGTITWDPNDLTAHGIFYINDVDMRTESSITFEGDQTLYITYIEEIILTLEPDATSVVQGGILGYWVYATNNTNEPKTFHYYTNVTLPNSSTYPSPPNWLFSYGPVTVSSGAAVNAHLVHGVPNTAPIGDYTYNAFIGLPGDIWNKAHFDFMVITAKTFTSRNHETNWKVIENGFDRSAIKGTMSSNTSSTLFTSLGQSYPNPFKGSTIISYSLATVNHVKLEIYDVAGNLIETLVDEKKAPGYYIVRWDGKDSAGMEVTSGVYFYKIQAHTGLGTGDYTETRKMILLR